MHYDWQCCFQLSAVFVPDVLQQIAVNDVASECLVCHTCVRECP
jgi:hypothetical protein